MATERARLSAAAEFAGRIRQRPPDDILMPLLTIEQVAQLLRVSPKTVQRLLKRGLPCIRFGRSVRFAPTAVSRWLEARQEGG